MRSSTKWTLEDILRLFEETGCPALDADSKNFIETNMKENVKKILTVIGRIWVAMPQKFPWAHPHNDSLVMAFSYDDISKKYEISALYPDVRIKEDNGNYFLDVVALQKK